MSIAGFSTSNTQAQNGAALLAHLQANNGHAEIPPGVYQCALSFTDMDVDIRGCGANNTVLQTSGAHGIAFDNSVSPRQVSIDNLSLQTHDASSQWYGVWGKGRTAGPGNVSKQIDIGRVSFVGVNAEALHTSWRTSIRIENICNGSFHDFWSRVDDPNGNHVELVGQNLNNAFSNTTMYGSCEAGFRAYGSLNEGVQMTNVTVLSARYGVRWVGGGVYLSCIGCDFDTTISGISGDVSQTKIVGCLFYAGRANDMRLIDLAKNNHTITGNTFIQLNGLTGAWGIRLNQSSQSSVTGNTFEQLNGGIVVSGDQCNAIAIGSNVMLSCSTDIYLGPGTTNSFTMGNTGNGGTHYADASGNATNAFVGKAYGSKTIHLS